MNVEDCYDITFYKEKREYRFISEGPKGRVTKIVRFDHMDDPDYYNLLLGDLYEDGTIDDEVITDNKDRDKVLATVGLIIYKFTTLHPDKFVFIVGGTPARTRLFRMMLSIYYNYLKGKFYLCGVLNGENGLIRKIFQKNEDYHAFVIRIIIKKSLYEKGKNHQRRYSIHKKNIRG